MATPVSIPTLVRRQKPAARRVLLTPDVLAFTGLLAFLHCAGSQLGFVGLSRPTTALGLRSPTRTTADRAGRVDRQAEPLRDSEGRKIKTPKTFDASDVSTVVGLHVAEFKKRPFGVMAYAPSTSGNGAMVWEMNEKSRYPGDPQGQAWVAGVKKGYAIKAVAGMDVSKWSFWDIMDLLNDKILDNSAGKFQSGGRGPMGNKPIELPVKIEFVQLKPDEAAPEESDTAVALNPALFVDRSDPRYADLPPDATFLEYKIPKAPAKYTSALVEEIRTYARSLPELAGYTGPRYTGPASINKAFVDAMLQNFKAGKLLPIKDAYKMALDVFDILVTEKTLGRVSIPEGKKVTVVGDLHGQLWDFHHMLGLAGYPSPDNSFVFNGDFVDRGPWSVEVMFSLLAFKLWHPKNVFLNRGNHESEMANTFYGFFGELEVKYEKKMTGLFAELFRATPLCHVINGEVFVVHGGIPGPDPRVWWKGIDNQISFDGRQIQISLEEIENSNRFMEPNPAENPLMVDLLWSDPKGKDGYGPSGRMSSGIYLFGPDVSRNFMQYNGLKMTLRSHEVKAVGYRYDHDGAFPLVTVFSAPNYVDKAGNMAAVAVMENRGGMLTKPQFIQYSAQPHPDVPSGAYAAGGPLHPASRPTA